ncbi:hypothetical protein M407DRAFT_151319 [Tulasnella calospora MUT 4182]|uniref:Uncharacterized protein n=1 Tax=Tulasnella calospora MUT 4182 TaxID=1051891 RepID=A0A0C3QY83_9AGAM|nr:hypothetical protein M407DRAFT_151319 [Tulasnella calospora MUT 4182]
MSTGPTPTLPEAAAQTYVGERAVGDNQQAPLPSQLIDVRNAEPVNEAPQQAATEPGSGTTVPATEESSGKLPFKKQVEAWAHVHHGTVTRNMDEKHHFQKVLAGEKPPPEH